MSIDNIADRVSESMVADEVEKSVAIDPAMILVIIQVITMIITKCDLFKKKPADIKVGLAKVSALQRWSLRRQVRHAIDDRHINSQYGDKIVDALIKVGAGATVADIETAIKEAKDL